MEENKKMTLEEFIKARRNAIAENIVKNLSNYISLTEEDIKNINKQLNQTV